MTKSLINVTSLGDLLLGAAERWPDNEVIIFPDRRLTYSELANRSIILARALQGSGIQSGEHVGILAPNLIEVIELLFAIALCDAVTVLINARYKTSELSYVIENADIKLLFSANRIDDYVDFPELLYESLDGLKDSTDISASLQLDAAPVLEKIVLLENIERPGLMPFDQFEIYAERVADDAMWLRRQQVKLNQPCIMMYTSGTTANPKGCRLNHEAIVRNATEISLRFKMTETDCQWNPLPMFHMSSIMPLLATMCAGGSFISATHFVADEALKVIAKEKPTILFTAFPAVMSAIVDHPDFNADEMDQIRLVNNVAPPNQLRKNMTILPQAIHISAYGMTEAAGISCFGSLDEDDEIRATTSGKPFPGVQMRVIDVDTGKEVKANERGEMTIKGFSLFEGYYKSPDKTREVFDEDGWFHTGDLCSQNEQGHVSYHGRIKDMLKVGGENVAALEIESFLCNHPAILISQVVSIPDEKLLEVAAAFIQLKPGMTCTEQEIVDFCTGKIANYKIPRYVRFVEEWPQSATKIQKHKLQQLLINELALK
jgi:acyl-CoA synthetase (AMP-forming)/AMP-acid ligase II